MIVIDIDKAQRGSVLIGRQGEHDFHQIQFVMGQWAAQHPTGGVAVVYERPDGETYPVVTAARPAAVVWKPNLADLSVAGAGRLECRITTEGGLGKSATIPVSVAPAIGTAGAVPMTPSPTGPTPWRTTPSGRKRPPRRRRRRRSGLERAFRDGSCSGAMKTSVCTPQRT